RGGDWLHHRLDDDLARCRLHPRALPRRLDRTALSRVRRDDRGGDPPLRRGGPLAHTHGFEHLLEATEPSPEPAVSDFGAGLRQRSIALRPRPALVAGPPPAHHPLLA